MRDQRNHEECLRIILQDLQDNHGVDGPYMKNRSVALTALNRKIRYRTGYKYKVKALEEKLRRIARRSNPSLKLNELFQKGLTTFPDERKTALISQPPTTRDRGPRSRSHAISPKKLESLSDAWAERKKKPEARQTLSHIQVRVSEERQAPRHPSPQAVTPTQPADAASSPQTPSMSKSTSKTMNIPMSTCSSSASVNSTTRKFSGGTVRLSTLEDESMRRQRRFLADDPTSFQPSNEQLLALRQDILDAIHNTVSHLWAGQASTGSTKMASFSPPARKQITISNFPDQNHAIVDLLRRVFGADSSSRIYQELGSRSIAAEDFLRAILGAAVNDWALEVNKAELHELVDRDTAVAEPYKEIMSAVAPELHAQTLAKSKRVYVDTRLEHEPVAHRLAQRFNSAVEHVLDDNGLESFRLYFGLWIQNLTKVFGLAQGSERVGC